MKITKIALLGLAGMLAVACGDDEKAAKGSLAVTVQLASDLTDVTTVQISALSEKDFDAADVTAASEKLADVDVSGTTLGQVVKELKAGTYRITASAYAGEVTVDGASRSVEVTVTADGVVLVAFTLSGSTDLVIGGITASNASPKTGDTVTLTADVSGNAGGSLVWTDNCDGDYVTNGAASVEWSSAFVENCKLTLTATNPATSATATINLSVGGAKGSLQRVAGSGFCHFDRQSYSSSYEGNESDYYGGRVLDGSETARNFPMVALAGLSVDAQGRLVFVEQHAGRVWRYDPSDDSLTRLAGATAPDTNNGNVHGDEGPAIAATFDMPMDVQVDSQGDIYVIDAWDYTVRRIYADTATIATVPTVGLTSYSTGVAVDDNGDVIGTMGTWGAQRVLKYYADTGTSFTLASEYAWDVEIYNDELYMSDRWEHAVYKMPLEGGAITYLAGTPTESGYTGDNGDATEATMFGPRGLTVDQSNGNIFVGDNGNNIRKITPAGKISTVLTVPGYVADIAMDSSKNLYYTDRGTCSLIKVYGPY